MTRLSIFKKFLLLLVVVFVSLPGIGQTLVNENFGTGTTIPTGWTTFNAGTGNNWTILASAGVTGSALVYNYHSSNTANAWIFSPDMSLEAGKTYTLQFQQKVYSATYPENLKITIGKGATVDAQTTVLADLPSLINGTYTLRTVEYACTETGTYNFAFKCYSVADMWTLYLDDVKFFIPVIPAAPTTINFTSVTSTGMTLGWVDNSSDETGFRVYYSFDNVSFFKYGSDIAANTTTQALVGLLPSTTYYFKIVAFADAESSALTGSQATNPAVEILSEVAGGNWSATTTWVGGVVPTAGDNVTIVDGSIVVLDAAGTCNNLTVGQGASGILSLNAFTLTVVNNLTIAANGKIDVTAGTAANLDVKGNLTNNGNLDLWNTSSIYGKLTFTGTANSSFTLNTGSVSDFDNGTSRGINVNKGTSVASVLDFIYNGGTVNIAGSGTPANGFFYLTNGMLKVSGTGTIAIPLFSTAAYTIPATGGVWLNNENFVIKGQSGLATLSGKLQISKGIYNVGTSDNNMDFSSGAIVLIEGGVFNIASRFSPGSSTNSINYTQTNGTVYVNSITANETSTKAAFDMGISTSTSFTMSGGTIVVCRTLGFNANYNGPSLLASVNITGGTLQLGTDAVVTPTIAATAAAQTFKLKNVTPTIIVNATNNPSVTLAGSIYVLGDLTHNGTGTFSLSSSYGLYMYGMDASHPGNIVNNGTMTFNLGSGTTLYFGSEYGNQVFTNNGTISGNSLPKLTIENIFLNGTVTIPAITVKDGASMNGTLNLYDGTLICPTLTLGGGAAGSGGFNCNMSGGLLQNAPTFDFGTGTVTYTYNDTKAQTTGVELPATLTDILSSSKLVINNAAGVTLNSPLNIDKLTLTSGNLTTTSTNLLTILNTTTTAITQTSGYVNGPLALTLPSNLATGSTYSFPIGKSAMNKFELVNPTTTADGTVTILAEVFDAATGGTAGTGIEENSLIDKYWKTEIVSGQANFTNTKVAITHSTALDETYALAKSSTLTGAYNRISGTAPTANRILSDEITELGFLAVGKNDAPTIIVSPSTLSFGYAANNTTSVEKTYTISAANLTPAAGNITIIAPANFEVSSTSGADFASSITLAYTGGTLASTTVYVVFKPTTDELDYSNNILNSGGSATDVNVQVTGTTIIQYCIPAPTSVDVNGITNVTLGTINNTTGKEAGNYGNYSNLIVDVSQGISVPISITYQTGYAYDTYAWIDFNNNGLFTDLGETFMLGTSAFTNPTTFSSSFDIPLDAPLGKHRIRIAGFDNGVNNPCYTGSYACFEDYSINITPAIYMEYASSLTTQTVITDITVGAVNQQIIGIEVVVTGTGFAIDLTKIVLNATGTTDINDISNAKIFYTGTSSTFATTTQFGTTIAAPTTDDFEVIGEQELELGTNYFWVTYDVDVTSLTDNFVDAVCSKIVVDGDQYVPTVTAPDGNRKIIGDDIAPSIVSASVENDATNIVVVTFDENIYITDLTGITINVEGSPVTISAYEINGAVISFTIETAIISHQDITFSHGANGTIEDIASNVVDVITDYIVDNNVESSEKDILAFDIVELSLSGTINGTNITFEVSLDVNVTALVPDIVISDYATISPESDVAQDFTSPVTYTVTAEDGTTKVYTVKINKIFTIPYTQNFDGVTAPALAPYWTVETNAVSWRTASNLTPISAPNSLATYCHTNVTTAKNDWAYTPALQLETGTTYVVKFKVQAPGWYGTPEKMEVKLGTSAIATAMTTQLWNDDNMLIATPTEKTFSFTVNTDGTYYLGWHAYSIADVDYIAIDDISITTPPIPTVTTAAITNVNSTGATTGGTVTDAGGVTISANGVVYSATDQTPTLGETDVFFTSDAVATTFVSTLTDLTAGTTYYVAAYATNETGTGYGEVLTFTPSSIDMGIVELVSPTNTGCFTVNETVTVTIKNFASTTIDFSVNPVTIKASSTGANPTIFADVVLNTGTLETNTTQEIEFATDYDMTVKGVYTFEASVIVVGDAVETNNLLTPVEMTSIILGGTYTIGDGGDYETITAAIEDLYEMTCMTGAIEYVLIDEDYNNETLPIYIEANSNFSATNTVTFKNDEGVTPTINALGTSGNQRAVYINGADYITFDGLNIVDAGTSATDKIKYGYYFASLNNLGADAVTYNTVKNCSIILGGGGAIIGYSCGVAFLNAANASAANSYNIVSNVTVDRADRGIMFFGANLTDNPTATTDTNNEISNCTLGSVYPIGNNLTTIGGSAMGIFVATSANVKIYNNIISSVYAENSGSTISALGISLQNVTGDIYNNQILGVRHAGSSAVVRAMGIQVGVLGVTGVANVYNNYITGITKDYSGAANATAGVFGIRSTNFGGGGGTANYYNNTVVLNAEAPVTYTSIVFGSFASNVQMVTKNNIFVNNISTSDAVAKAYIIQDANATSYLTSNNNDLVATGTNAVFGIFGTTDQLTFEDWKTATGQDANSTLFVPTFVSETDFHLVPELNCGISGMGTPIALVTTDFDGDTRDIEFPDLGADEFNAPEVTANITNLSTTGFIVTFNPAIEGLDESNFLLDNSAIVTSTTTTDNGASYVITATLQPAVDYTLTTDFECYIINDVTFSIQGIYIVTFEAIGNGNLDVTVDGNTITSPAEVEALKDVVFTAIPDPGHRIKSWTLDGDIVNGTSETYSITAISKDAEVIVKFEAIPTFTVTFDVVNSNGSLEATVDGNTISSPADVEENTIVKFKAVPANGYRVKKWTLNDQPVSNNISVDYEITITDADADVTVEFEVIPANTSIVSFSVVSGNGAIAATVNSATIINGASVPNGSNITFTATPNPDYQVKQWKVNNEVMYVENTTDIFVGEELTYENLSTDINVTVEYELMPIVSAVLDSYEATVYAYTPEDVVINITWNSATDITKIIASEGTPNEEILIKGNDYTLVGNVLTIIMTNSAKGTYQIPVPLTIKFDKGNDAIFVLTYVLETYIVNFNVVNGNGNGTLSAIDQEDNYTLTTGDEVLKGGNVIFTATPKNNTYKVKQWKVDGEVVVEEGTTNIFEGTELIYNDLLSEITVTVEFEIIINIAQTTNNIRLYPNPTNAVFVVETSNPAQITVSDATGKIVYSQNNLNSQVTIDLSSNANGIYFVKIVENGNITYKKLIKE